MITSIQDIDPIEFLEDYLGIKLLACQKEILRKMWSTDFIEQAYSPVLKGISTDCPEKYLERVKELKLDFYKPEEIP